MNPAARISESTVDAGLLSALIDADGPRTVAELAGRLGRDAGTVQRAVKALRRAGCAIETSGPGEIQLCRAALGTWLDYLQHRLGARRPIYVYSATSSTQDAARRLLADRASAADRAVLVADQQTAGRGRFGRAWHTPHGQGLTFSLVHPGSPGNSESGSENGDALAPLDGITAATSVALAEAIEPWLGAGQRPVQIRWPNDLYVNDAKLGGILVETVQSGDQRAAIIGVGLNVNQDDATLGSLSQSLDRRVASMRQVRGRPAPRVGVLGDAIAALDDRLSADRTSGWVEAWRKRCPLLHQTVKLQCDRERLEGEVLDLDPRHGLIVRHPTGGIMHLPATRTTVL